MRTSDIIAEELESVRIDLVEVTDTYDDLRQELAEALRREGKSYAGHFVLKVKSTLTMVDKEKAQQWIKEHYPHLFKPDLNAVSRVLRQKLQPLPDGFEIKQTEYVASKNISNDVGEAS